MRPMGEKASTDEGRKNLIIYKKNKRWAEWIGNFGAVKANGSRKRSKC